MGNRRKIPKVDLTGDSDDVCAKRRRSSDISAATHERDVADISKGEGATSTNAGTHKDSSPDFYKLKEGDIEAAGDKNFERKENVTVKREDKLTANDMFPAAVDQSRQESLHPQTVHVHMHQLCPCLHSYYSGYRPPMIPPYVQPVARPYNLQHYQYTQFNLSPLNYPIVHPGTTIVQQSPTGTPTHQPMDFGPPPRDRRNFEGADVPDVVMMEAPKEGFFDDYATVASNLNDVIQDPTVSHLATPVENFTKYLEHGCIMAEKIAIRNQHRPCFKNIQNLCNRTRSEILKPSNTVSNIHSQGIPWATKDFIYAFVRLINCWHMLKGYLDSKDGTLGNIDRELTADFKSCYLGWEKNTKELATHMIRIFTNLDNNVSNPNATPINKNKESPKDVQKSTKETPAKVNRNVLQTPHASIEVAETILLSESTTSPRDEDSDNESRVYMKPGSYNVPKKNHDSSNSSPSIEFFDTAQNVSAHYKKIAKKKQHEAGTNDKMWQDAQSAVPYLMNKMNSPTLEGNAHKKSEDPDDSSLKYFVHLSKLEHGSNIQEWLNNNNFSENQIVGETGPQEGLLATPCSSKPVTVLQRSLPPKPLKGDLCDYQQVKTSPRCLRTQMQPKTHHNRKTKKFNMWEHETGGLTPHAVLVLEDVLKELERREFSKYLLKKEKDTKFEMKYPTSLNSISRKLTSHTYNYINEFVHDLRHIIICAETFYESTHEISVKIRQFERAMEELLTNRLSSFDFGHISGERDEECGPLIYKKNKKSDGDADH